MKSIGFLTTLLALALIFSLGCDSAKQGATPPANYADFPGEDTMDGGRSRAAETRVEPLDDEVED